MKFQRSTFSTVLLSLFVIVGVIYVVFDSVRLAQKNSVSKSNIIFPTQATGVLNTPSPTATMLPNTPTPLPSPTGVNRELVMGKFRKSGTSCQEEWDPFPEPVVENWTADAAFQEELEALVKTIPGNLGVYVKDLRTGETYTISGDEIFHPASTIKVAIAMDLFSWLEQNPSVKLSNGIQPNKRSYEQLLVAMLKDSEEIATDTVSEFVNSQKGFNLDTKIHEWGAVHTTTSPRRSTPADLALLLEKFYRGQILSPQSTHKMLDIMHITKKSDQDRIGGGLPKDPNICLAHKTGSIEAGVGNDGLGVLGDIGIVETPDTAYIIVALVNDINYSKWTEAKMLISDISRLAYKHFTQ